MQFSPADIINLIALLTSLAGSFMMFYYSPKVSSQLYLYQKEEMKLIKQKDELKNKRIRQGMFLVMVGFGLQAVAIFINVAFK